MLPQTISATNDDVSLFLRVTQPFGKVKLTVSDGENILAVSKKLKAAPGEMEKNHNQKFCLAKCHRSYYN